MHRHYVTATCAPHHYVTPKRKIGSHPKCAPSFGNTPLVCCHNVTSHVCSIIRWNPRMHCHYVTPTCVLLVRRAHVCAVLSYRWGFPTDTKSSILYEIASLPMNFSSQPRLHHPQRKQTMSHYVTCTCISYTTIPMKYQPNLIT